MRTIACFTFLLFGLPFVANAASMCVPGNIYVAVLIPDQNGVSSVAMGDGTFKVTFDYVTASANVTTTNNVLGVASCNEMVGTPNSTDGNISASASDIGKNCWCALSKPLITGFAYTGSSYSTDEACASDCINVCMNKVQNDVDFRTAIYGAIW